MKLPHLRSEQIKNQPDQTAALINRLVDEVEKKGDGGVILLCAIIISCFLPLPSLALVLSWQGL